MARGWSGLWASVGASFFLGVLPAGCIMIKEGSNRATSRTAEIKYPQTAGAGPSTSQMHAAASNASAMPPSSDSSAARRDFSVWLRIAALTIRPSGHAPRRQVIMTISGNNVALLTDCILAAFRGSDVMVHRDIRSVSKRLAFQSVCPRGRSSRPQAPGADHPGTRAVNNSLTGYREVAAGGGGTLAVPR